MTFELKPGDFIRTANVPEDQRQNVIDAFVAAGAVDAYDFKSNDYYCSVLDYMGFGDNMFIITSTKGKREVTLDQILGKPMLIEALKPGMRAKMLCGIVRHHESGFIKWEESKEYCNYAALTTTDYEIIQDEPKPWVPSKDDYGYLSMQIGYDVKKVESVCPNAFKTQEGAQQAANIMQVTNTICNMPGYGKGDAAMVYLNDLSDCVAIVSCAVFFGDFAFDTYENAKAAAKEANKKIKELEQ